MTDKRASAAGFNPGLGWRELNRGESLDPGTKRVFFGDEFGGTIWVSDRRMIAESVALEHLRSQLSVWAGEEISPENLIKHLMNNFKHLADVTVDNDGES